MLSVCLDMGTSMIKAVAFDEQGGERALVRRPMEVLRPKPGFAEQDMNALWDAVASSVREVVEQLDAEVEMLAFTGQGDGCWLVDQQGQPTGAAVLWNDARNAVRLQEWERDGTLERAFEINGSLGFPGLPNAVLPWLREHEPERVTRAHRSMFCDGWIFLRLTGEFGIDESDASVPLLDIRRGEYSDELLEMFDLQWARELLPEIRRGESSLGKLSADAAAATGLQEGLPVVMARSTSPPRRSAAERSIPVRRAASWGPHCARRSWPTTSTPAAARPGSRSRWASRIDTCACLRRWPART
jgi:erythritol kinase (D-erythritol 1-phosphate-forming)